MLLQQPHLFRGDLVLHELPLRLEERLQSRTKAMAASGGISSPLRNPFILLTLLAVQLVLFNSRQHLRLEEGVLIAH